MFFNTFGYYVGELLGMRTRAAYSSIIYREVQQTVVLYFNTYIVMYNTCNCALALCIIKLLCSELQILTLWASQHQKITTGKIVNLLSTDVEQVNMVRRVFIFHFVLFIIITRGIQTRLSKDV